MSAWLARALGRRPGKGSSATGSEHDDRSLVCPRKPLPSRPGSTGPTSAALKRASEIHHSTMSPAWLLPSEWTLQTWSEAFND